MTSPPLKDQLSPHIEALRRYARVLSRNRTEAEDIVQECLIRAIASADSFEEGRDLRTWLFRILHNVHVSHVRQTHARARVHQDMEAGLASVEPSQTKSIEVREAMAALAKLPEDQRRAVMLIAVEELRYEEAARRLGIPIGTFMSRLGRGREALRNLLRGDRAPKLRIVGKRP